jgi:hypothetical protein
LEKNDFFSFKLSSRTPRSREQEQRGKSAKNMIAVSTNFNLMLLARSKQLTVEEEAHIFQSSSSFDP